MKTLLEQLNESLFLNDIKKCKTLEELVCKFNKIDTLEELTNDDMKELDLGFVWFGDDMDDVKEFITKVRSYGDEKIKSLKVTDNTITFKCGDDTFDLDYVD